MFMELWICGCLIYVTHVAIVCAFIYCQVVDDDDRVDLEAEIKSPNVQNQDVPLNSGDQLEAITNRKKMRGEPMSDSKMSKKSFARNWVTS